MFGGTGYNIELTPRAWAQIGTLERAEFEHVRATLTDFAARLAAEPAVTVEDPRTLRTGALLLSCSIDAARRVVLLQSLARDLSEHASR